MTIRGFFMSRFMRVVAIAIIILSVCHLTLILLAAHHLSVVEQDISAAGLPQSLGQVLPQATAENNAAHTYEKTFVLLSLDSEDIYSRDRSTKVSPRYEQIINLLNRKYDVNDTTHLRKDYLDPTLWSSDEQATAWSTLSTAEFTNVRELLIEAADKPSCVFIQTWSDGPAMRLPMLNLMRNAAYLLNCHALLSQQHGDSRAMREDFAAALGLAYHVQQIPVLICNLVCHAIETMTFKSMSLAMAKSPLGDTAALEQRIATGYDPQATAKDFDCERIMMGDSVFGAHGIDMMLGVKMGLYHGYVVTPLRLYEHACYDRVLACASIAARKQLPLPNMPLPALALVSRLLMPSMSMVYQNLEDQRKIRAIAQTALALEHAHRDSGSYPSRLSDLARKYLTADTLSDLKTCVFVSQGSSWYLDGMPVPDPATRDSRKAGNRQLLWQSPRSSP